MSICFKIFISFDRYNGQIGAFEIYRLNETEPSMSFLCKKYYDTYIYDFFKLKVSGSVNSKDQLKLAQIRALL